MYAASWREHDIRIPLPDAPDDLFPHGQRGQQFAVMVVEHFVRDAQPPSGLLRFGAATFGQRAASHRLMAGIAIGHGNELDRGAQRAELGGGSRGADVAIVRVRAERDHAQGDVLCQQRGRRQEKKDDSESRFHK
jgi:hypothetical protein